MQQNMSGLRSRVELETKKLIPHYKDAQMEVSSTMTQTMALFLEQTLSNCQQRVRGNSSISLSGPQWPDQNDRTSHDLQGVGSWPQFLHYKLLPSAQLVHGGFCAPSSMMLVMRDGGQEVVCRVDCTKQQMLTLLGFNKQPTGHTCQALISHHEEQVSMDADGSPEMVPDCSPMDMSGSPRPTGSPAGTSPSSINEQSSCCGSDSTDSADSIADELISRLSDIILDYCGGPAIHGNFDVISQAVGSAVADFVYELLDELGTFPSMNQCPDRGGSDSTFSTRFGGDEEDPSRGVDGQSLGGQGAPDSGGGMQQRGTGGDGPPNPKKSGIATSGDNPSKVFRWSCPYRMRNPGRFNIRDHKSCVIYGWISFEKLK